MKKVVICLIVLVLHCFPVLAKNVTFPYEQQYAFSLDNVHRTENGFVLELICENQTSEEKTVIVGFPELNGQPAMFGNSWNTDTLHLPAYQTVKREITIQPDYGNELPRSASIRIIVEGCVSTPLRIDWTQSLETLSITDISGNSVEPQIIHPSIQTWLNSSLPVLHFFDCLSLDQYAMLEKGDLIVCLDYSSTGKTVIPFCRIPVSVDPDGYVYASYSGLAVVLAGVEDTPVATVETCRNEKRLLNISGISLFGDQIFYADLSIRILIEPDGFASLDSYTVMINELGGYLFKIPYSLFTNLQTSLEIDEVVKETEGIRFRDVDENILSMSVDEPLHICLIPAADIGELSFFFEYQFTDQSTRIVKIKPQ